MILRQLVWDSVHVSPVNTYLGMNLREINYYDGSHTFCDAFKTCDEWRTTRVSTPTSNLDAFDFSLRSDGYPVELPQSDGAGIDDYCVATYLLWGVDFPTGDYLLRFKGTGSITLQEGASGTFTTPDTDHDIPLTSGSGVRIVITASDVSDPIRDIEFIMTDCKDIYQTQTFNPIFLERLEGYDHIRFMWWGEIWSGGVYNTDWSARRTPDYYTQGGGEGVALEYMIELCNTLQCDAWICVPHTCTDAFMLSTAQFIYDNLDSNLKWIFEYSNETWNGGQYRDPSAYVEAQGILLGLDVVAGNEFGGGQLYTALRSAELFEVINSVYGTGSERVRRVLSGQMVVFNCNLMLDYLANTRPDLPFPDAFSTAPYFGGNIGQEIVDDGVVDTITTDEIIDRAVADLTTVVYPQIESFITTINSYGIDHVTYECGHHVIPGKANEENVTLVNKLQVAMSDERMYQISIDYYDGWIARGGKHFCWFSWVMKDSKYGYFGVLQNAYSDISTAPRYRAMRNILGLD